jgi:hypothetical protein
MIGHGVIGQLALLGLVHRNPQPVGIERLDGLCWLRSG